MDEQLSLSDIPPDERVVNVASVPHRSPFRYPGGKTWLVPRIRRWLESLPGVPAEFIEPFAGGAIVGLTVAFEKLADHVTLVELDADVSAVWQTILSDDAHWLADQIAAFRLTPESVEELLSREDVSLRERALQTIVRNRINRGGILAAGAGRLKYGENGKGIASRWYPKTLCRRILDIHQIRDRLAFVQADGLDILRQNAGRENTVFFIDPPYTAAGKGAGRRLYTHWELDHERLFQMAQHLAGDFVMTYENARSIHELAHRYSFDIQPIAMRNTHHARLTELLVGRDLAWARQAGSHAALR